MTRRSLPALSLAVVWLWGDPALAQEAPAADPPAHISFVDGSAVLERDGRVDAEPLSMPLLAGDRLRTQAGRVEVLFGDGSALHLDTNTIVDFQSDEVVRLLDGRIRLSVAGPSRELSYRVDAPSAWVQINDPGEYRVALLRADEVELAVLRGAAELVNEQGRSYIRAGERTFARAGAAPSPPYVFNSAAWDAFDRWSESRRAQRIGVSAQYLPGDVRPYAAAFDAYGAWRYEPVYGYVWYPRVHVGWRPYYRGRWVSLRPFGWTWITGDPWGWPTHHYGRWGISAGVWFWIPGHTWGPAWVSWAYAPGYVSWCPLGWNNRPVLSILNVNVYGGRRYDPWYAWTVVPRHHFGGTYVNVPNIRSVRVEPRIHSSFVVRDSAPEVRYAVGRAAPIRTTGRYAVPRSTTTAVGPARSDTASSGGFRSADRRLSAATAPGRPPAANVVAPDSSRTASPTDRALARQRRTEPTADSVPAQRSAGSGSRAVLRGGIAATAPSPSRVEPGDAPVSTPPGQQSVDVDRVPRGRSIGRDRTGTRETFGPNAAPVTAPPAGAVRAAPRAQQSDEGVSAEAPARSQERSFGSPDRTRVYPRYSPPSASTPSPAVVGPVPPAAADKGLNRASPRYPSAPERRGEFGGGYGAGSGEVRSRGVPRSDAPAPLPPSYRAAPEPRAPEPRAAPERRAPSGSPPAAAPAPAPPADRGVARPRGGGESGAGPARRRG